MAANDSIASEGGVAELRAFLQPRVEAECVNLFGVTDSAWIEQIVSAWLDDENNSAWRYEELAALAGRALREGVSLLDMACGCGTFVFYGLRRGYDAWGVDPEAWKHEFNRLKIRAYGYPQSWSERFLPGVGELLPFEDDRFDYVSSYQTLEHVDDPDRCIAEMIRVTKPGGGVHLRCPDYRGTFEGHYRLPWLPLFPRSLARLYLRIRKRPVEGLKTIRYVTKRKLIRAARQVLGPRVSWSGRVVDLDRERVRAALRRRQWPVLAGLFHLYQGASYLRKVFRAELESNIFIQVLSK